MTRGERWALRLAVLVAFALTALSGACVSQQQPAALPAVVYVVRVVPPPEWRMIYTQVEKCLSQRGDYESVEWYATSTPWKGQHGTTHGFWRVTNGHRKIIIVGADTATVRHEAVHDVLHLNGFVPVRAASDSTNNPEHPADWFGDGKCARRFAQ